MKTLILVLSLISCVAIADPVPYYDPSAMKLKQERARLKEERKLARRTTGNKQIRVIHITLFVAGTILLWYEQTDHKK